MRRAFPTDAAAVAKDSRLVVEGILENAEAGRSAYEVGDRFGVGSRTSGAAWTLPVFHRLECSLQTQTADDVTLF